MKLRTYAYLGAIVILAFALHVYENVAASSSASTELTTEGILFSLIVLIWSLTPYIGCLFVAFLFHESIGASVGVTIALILDLQMHHAVVTSTSSTAMLGYINQPLWNLVLVLPLSIGVTLLVTKRRRSKHAP